MYNRLIERGRSTQILGPSNINSKTAEHHANEKKCLQYLNDLLVVSKIPEPEPENITNEKIDEDVLAALNSLMEEELAEQNQISKENDEIVKKQYQILQADERGRLAINAEIAEIRKRQDDKLRALQARRHALEIEKARAKQIASKPPPLPKSVKLLLRDERNKLLDPPKNPTNEVIPNDPDDEIVNSSDKENVVLSEEERKAAEKLKEERNMKAQKRFNEALKKDREKKEQDELLKKIEYAKCSQRRETAKNISSEKGTKMPCFYPDRLHNIMKNADMENAVENVCKKSTSKEHAIEDIEGYEDIWEKKYEKVNPDLQEKLIDCIPNFVKENYEYLLQEESEYQIGNRFSDEIESELNLGFISSSPVLSPCKRKEDNMDTVITKLDERRAEFQSMYEKTIKPYLEAEIDASKKDYSDKAVATDLLKPPPAEDKAVEANIAPTFQSPPYVDYLNTGFMNIKRRDFGPNFKFFKTEDLGAESTYNHSESEKNRHRYDTWSSSSYCSLPPNHGIPNFEHFCDIHNVCDICIAERNAHPSKTLLQSKSAIIDTEEDKFSKEPSCVTNQEVDSPKKSSVLSSYVKSLADKYFAEKPVSSAFNKSILQQNLEKSDGHISSYSHPEKNVAQSEDEENASSFNAHNVTSYTSPGLKLDQHNEEFSSKLKPVAQLDIKREEAQQSSRFARTDNFASKNGINLQSSAFEQNEVLEQFDQEAEDARLKLIKQFVFRNSPKSNSGPNIQSHVLPPKPEKCDMFVGKSETPHVYHELSTIQEMDSAITSETPHLSYSESLLEQKSMKKGDSKFEGAMAKQALDEEYNDTISLLDEPPSHVTELAKNICFVASSENTSQSSHSMEEPKASAVSSSLDKSSSVTSKIHVSKLDSISGPSLSLSSTCKVSLSPKKLIDSSSSSSVSIPRESTPHLHHKKYFPDHFEDLSDIQLQNSKSSSTSIEQDNATPILGKSNENKTTKKDSTLFVKPEVLYSKDYNNDNQFFSSSNSFNPMCCHSDISSTETVSKTLDNYKNSNKRLLDPLSPVLGSIPAAKVCQTSEKSENSRNFYPLSLCSKILTPSGIEPSSDKKSDGFSTSASSFKALSPVSNISSPLSNKSEQNLTSPESSSNVNFKPMTLHFNISTPGSERIKSDESEALRNIGSSQEQLGLPSLSSVTCNVTVHAKSSRLQPSLSENAEIPELKTEAKLLSSDSFLQNLTVASQAAVNNLMEGEALTKKEIHPCKSGHFIPQINIYDCPQASDQSEIPVFKIRSLEEIEKEYLMKNNEKILCHSALPKTLTNKKNECETKKLFDTNAIISLTSEDMAVKGGCEISSSSKTQHPLHNLKKSLSLQSLASFSSSENVAEMFSGSKITDQSTPVKGFDCTQERGILEEPDLTLISTISSESYLQQKRHTDLDNLSNKENLELTLSVKNTPSICTDKTTTATSDSPFQTGCVDSPSMMSFMQHEISCLAQESAEEIKIKEKKKKTKVEYKKYQARTKRLWNNLEEVQKKHLQESKMQQLVMNRIKAKEFAKKLTPKRKEEKP